jgi:DNA repair exonuclease SbcCD ATPase subunit
VLEKAREALEEMIALLGDRLETFAAGSVATPERLPAAQQLDVRTRQLHERLRDAAREIRRDAAGPRELAAALANVAAGLRLAEARVANARAAVAQAFRVRIRPDGTLVRTMGALDAALDAELEKDVLYLDGLLDKQRAEDLVRLAKDLGARRRDLAGLLEKYRKAPSEAGKRELLARIGRMKERVKDLLSRMAQLSKGFNDEHMNEEALAELAKSKDLVGGLDDVEKRLAQGDVEGAMKALDQMASTMDEMLAGLQRTAGRPDERSSALMKEMLAFKDELEKVKAEQEQTAGETESVRAEYRKKLEQKLKGAEAEVKRLEKLAAEARKDVESAQPGVTYRAEIEYEQAREALSDLERALGMKELGAALETAQRAAPSVERLSRYLQEDAELAQESPIALRRDAAQVRDAHQKVDDAVPKAREVRDSLSRLFPDPRSVLGQDAQKRLQQLSQRQSALEKRAEGLQQKLAELSQQAPIFPPDAQGQLGETRGHMGQAAAELGNRNPQRGHGEQALALDALSRFQKGLEEAAKKGRGQGGGQGFPFPFAEGGGRGEESGDGRESSRERVKIPGAEAYKVPEEFRKDLLDAMKEGTPDRYKGDVQRYYEELVK